jgi:glycosyltransferase involved in cell wall biosynthesis
MTRNVIFLQAKIPDNETELSALSVRWLDYLDELGANVPNPQIGVFSFKTFSVTQAKFLLVEKIYDLSRGFETKPLLLRVYSFYRLIASSNQSFTFVCGDTHISFLLALALRTRYRSSIKIQTQYHGSIYSLGNRRNFKMLLKVMLSRFAIIKSDSLRIVSEFQIDELCKISSSAHERIVLAPIPMDYSRVSFQNLPKIYDLCIVGRLHEERGTENLIEIISFFKRARPRSLVVIAGDGPDRHKFMDRLSNWIQDGSITLVGRLQSNEVAELFSSTRILLSSAPTEGYGLTIREAALSGVRVVARRSKGTQQAQLEYPSHIQLFEQNLEAIDLIQRALLEKTPLSTNDLVCEQKTRDSKAKRALIASWI